MGKHGFFKGIAIGAVLAALAAMHMEEMHGNPRAKAAKKAAKEVMKRAVAHAKTVGKVTKAAFDKIVGATLMEYKDAKSLTNDEMLALKAELKDSWKKMKGAMK